MLRFVKESPPQDGGHCLQMSSMIDIVFLLLVFFVMTFRITSQEGDFSLATTAADGNTGERITINLPLRLKLDATPEGDLLAMNLNGEHVASFDELQTRLIGLAEADALRDVTLTLDCDANLSYQHVIATLDHVTGYRNAAGRLQPLVTTTRFASRQ